MPDTNKLSVRALIGVRVEEQTNISRTMAAKEKKRPGTAAPAAIVSELLVVNGLERGWLLGLITGQIGEEERADRRRTGCKETSDRARTSQQRQRPVRSPVARF